MEEEVQVPITEKTFLQVLEELPSQEDEIVKIDYDFLVEFCNNLISNKSIKGIRKIDDVLSKFDQALDCVDELMKVNKIYKVLNNILFALKSNMEVNYFEHMSIGVQDERQ